MSGISGWIVEWLSRTLEPDEREAVLGDLAELGEPGIRAVAGMAGLVARRQAALWNGWRPWLALIALVIPVGLALPHCLAVFRSTMNLYGWIVTNYRDIDPGVLNEIGLPLRRGAGVFVSTVTLMVLWSWTCGFALAALSRGTAWAQGALLTGFWIFFFAGTRPPFTFAAALILVPFFLGLRRCMRKGMLEAEWAAILAVVVAGVLALAMWCGNWSIGGVIYIRQLAAPALLSWPACYLFAASMQRQRRAHV